MLLVRLRLAASGSRPRLSQADLRPSARVPFGPHEFLEGGIAPERFQDRIPVGVIPNTPPLFHGSFQQPDRLVKIAELSGDASLPDRAPTSKPTG